MPAGGGRKENKMIPEIRMGKRLKERREQLGLTRQEVAQRLGVTASAISNYENNVSCPKVELLVALFEVLHCDANYLYQDCCSSIGKCDNEEWDLIRGHRCLDRHGKDMVQTVLKKELEHSAVSLEAAARNTKAGQKTVSVEKDFDPAKIENQMDF